MRVFIIRSKEELGNFLEDSCDEITKMQFSGFDYLVSTGRLIDDIRINTSYTQGDLCDYLKEIPVEIRFVENSGNQIDSILYLYRLRGDNVYRQVCP